MEITWINAAQKGAGMVALGTRVGTHYVFEWADDVAQAGEDSVRDTVNMGGINPTKKGGPRIKTGAMIDSADSDATAMAGVGVAKAGFGVKSAAPFYTKFQEDGTRRGVSAMLAIPTAANRMQVEATNSGLRMMTRIQAEWNAI